MNALDLLTTFALDDYRDIARAALSEEDYASHVLDRGVSVFVTAAAFFPEGTPKIDVIREVGKRAAIRKDEAKLAILLAAGAEWLEMP